MPNENSIKRPVSLVGTGRSGTTLLTNVFRQHPSFESYGETANLIFPAYYHAEKCLPFCRPEINKDNAAEYATVATRSMLCGVFPDDNEYWFHKPIMIPSIQKHFDSHEALAAWYWKTYRTLFPDAFTLTVIRRPESVIASYMRRWGQSIQQAKRNYRLTYDLLLNSSDCIDHVISFEDLVYDSESTVKKMFATIGCEYHETCLVAFEKVHAPNKTDGKHDTLSDIKDRLKSSDVLTKDQVGKEVYDIYERVNDKFGINDCSLAKVS